MFQMDYNVVFHNMKKSFLLAYYCVLYLDKTTVSCAFYFPSGLIVVTMQRSQIGEGAAVGFTVMVP